jgi:hypothetical protein
MFASNVSIYVAERDIRRLFILEKRRCHLYPILPILAILPYPA